MKASDVPCPDWMQQRLKSHGSQVPFSTFMEWALHDPEHGAYGAGHLRVGTEGDFVTSPSLGDDFSALLAQQLIEWLEVLARRHPDQPLAVVDVGPGEGHLIDQLRPHLAAEAPDLIGRLECVLVELNPGMEARQRSLLSNDHPIPCRWSALETLRAEPLIGILIAHELLDAFPVERLIVRDGTLQRQLVQLQSSDQGPGSLVWGEAPLPADLSAQIQQQAQRTGFPLPPMGVEDGWATEWHHAVEPWLRQARDAMQDGMLLVVDYAMEASRYYAARRPDGTLTAYRQQQASGDVLRHAGEQDITAHLCLETLLDSAKATGWMPVGQCRQGEALLALGLSERFTALQQLPGDQLDEALRRRESLLRLVDPSCLGELRWLAFQRSAENDASPMLTPSRFLREPG